MKINEVVLMPDFDRESSEMPGEELLGMSSSDLVGEGFRHLFRYQGNSIFSKQDSGETLYAVANPADRITAVMVTQPYGTADQVTGIVASKENTLKIPALYHLLIVKYDITLVSDYIQSPGGKKVWERLSDMPGVQVDVWDHKANEFVNTESDDAFYDINDPDNFAESQHWLLIATRR